MAQATGPSYRVKYKRRRKNLTDFRLRLALVKSGLPRLVIRKTNRGVIVQLMEFRREGDRVLSSVHSCILKNFGWHPRRNTPTAYLCGLLCAKKALSKNPPTSNFCADIGLQSATQGSLVFAAVKGALDGGLKSNFSERILIPERLDGSAISQYAKKLKEESQEKFQRLFGGYAKEGADVEKLPELFARSKERILSL